MLDKTGEEILISLKGKVRSSFQMFFLGQCGKFCHLKAHPAHEGRLLRDTSGCDDLLLCPEGKMEKVWRYAQRVTYCKKTTRQEIYSQETGDYTQCR